MEILLLTLRIRKNTSGKLLCYECSDEYNELIKQ